MVGNLNIKTMSIKKKYNKGELAKDILVAIAVGGLVVSCVAMPGLAYIFALFKPKNSYEKNKVRQAIKKMQKQKLIRIYSKNGRDIIEITKNGQKKLLEYKIDEMKIKKPKKWDGLYRVVMFDIPEKKVAARREISFRLKEIGAIPIQKSTFVSPFECRNEIDFIGEYFGVRKNIIYLIAKEIDNEVKIKKFFNLK